MDSYKNQTGFLLISIVIALAIIAILAAVYFTGSGKKEDSSAFKAGQKGIEQTKQNNETMLNQNLEIQNQLNSIDQ